MKIKTLKTPWEKLLGLMFKNKLYPVYFETHFGIHTFFVKSPIDVVVCDENFIVRKIGRNIKPGRIFLWNPKYFRVFEFPSGHKALDELRTGDNFSVTENI